MLLSSLLFGLSNLEIVDVLSLAYSMNMNALLDCVQVGDWNCLERRTIPHELVQVLMNLNNMPKLDKKELSSAASRFMDSMEYNVGYYGAEFQGMQCTRNDVLGLQFPLIKNHLRKRDATACGCALVMILIFVCISIGTLIKSHSQSNDISAVHNELKTNCGFGYQCKPEVLDELVIGYTIDFLGSGQCDICSYSDCQKAKDTGLSIEETCIIDCKAINCVNRFQYYQPVEYVDTFTGNEFGEMVTLIKNGQCWKENFAKVAKPYTNQQCVALIDDKKKIAKSRDRLATTGSVFLGCAVGTTIVTAIFGYAAHSVRNIGRPIQN